MARKIRRGPRVYSRQHKPSPYQLENQKRTSLLSERKGWKHATCPVCLESPHNAVLLLCSSHDKGCRPYICGTSFRFSNCLEQFQKACTEKKTSPHELDVDNLAAGWPAWKKSVAMDLKCPLCRGQVKGWTIVVPARAHLNKRKRACAQDDCSFIGRYKQLLKHARAMHRSAKPRSIDPVLEKKWKVLENQMEQEDVFSTIRSAMPNSVVLGDYVIDFNHSDYDSDDSFDDNYDLSSDDSDVSEWRSTRNLDIRIRESVHNRRNDDLCTDDSDWYSDDSDVSERRSTRNVRVRGRVHNRHHGSRHRVGHNSHHRYGVNRHTVYFSRRASAEVDSDVYC